ncbi:hypothetical protein DFH09DRAFT_1194776 [Mycena vulgaris]|nr:hypothetical protein DFH09DRAFT_1194776 [Mycena vulgaris]
MSGTFDPTIYSLEQLANSGFSQFYCYTRRQNVGLVVVSLAGFVSLAAVITMFGLILRNIIRNRRLPKSDRSRLITRPMDLFLSLFTADLFQSLGVVMDVRWINKGIVEVGEPCTAQGALQNIGQAGIAMTTFIITVHTFDSIWRGNGGATSVRWASILVAIVWTFLVLAIVISTSVHKDPPFYAPTPYWCWINSSYPKYRIALENFWLWIGFAVAILYVPLLFWDTGRTVPGDPQWWTFKLHTGDARNGERRSNFIICALAYCLPVLPTSLARWFLVVRGDVNPFASAEAQFTVKGIFSLSGVCDVFAFKYARSGLLLFPSDQRPKPRESEASLKSQSEISLHSSDKVVTKGPLKKHWRLLGANAFSSPTFILTGLSFNSPNTATPVASFSFRQNGVLDYQYDYRLTNEDADPARWRFAPAPGQGLTISQTMTYDVANDLLVATCAGNTSQCTQGSFDESGFLSFTLNNSLTPATVRLRALDKDWVYGKADDAPSFLLKEVQAGWKPRSSCRAYRRDPAGSLWILEGLRQWRDCGDTGPSRAHLDETERVFKSSHDAE